MIGLYLIFIAIAGLGILALALIALGHSKPRAKKILLPEINKQEKSTVTSNINQEPQLASIIARKSNAIRDPELAALGFGGLDEIAIDEQSDPTISDTFFEEERDLIKPIPKQQTKTDNKPIIFYVLAKPDRPFSGYEFLQAMLAADLRFGEMNIFHRYEQIDLPGKTLFSAASAIEPGIFDLANVGALTCPGLCLFMSPHKIADPEATFELMLETALQLAEDLDGQLCDAERNLLSEETIEEYRTQIQG